MSLVISSTTDDQAAVNAAAGITEEAPETTQQPPEAARPPKPQEPIEVPDEEEEDEGEGEQETEEGEPQPVKTKKLGGWQRKIAKLEEANQYAYRKLAQLEDSLKPKQEAQGPPPRPKLEDYPDNYDAYIEALADWKTDRKLEVKEQENLRKAREWQAQEARRAVVETYSTRANEFKSKVKDFDDVLESVEDIRFHPDVQQSLLTYEHGPRLAYELARHRPQAEKIAALSMTNPLDALRELGRFEASLTAGAPPRIETRKPFTAPPEPIRPVGKGSNGNVRVPLDQLDYQDFKRARNADIKARRG